MRFPRRFSLRLLFISVAVIAAIVAVIVDRMHRGWTIEKVERLIAAEFNPDWDRFDLSHWIQSHGFETDTSKAPLDLHRFDASDIKRQGADELQFVVRARIGPEQGSNISLFKSGDIYAFFFYDSVGRFARHILVAYPDDDPAMPRKPSPKRERSELPRGEVGPG